MGQKINQPQQNFSQNKDVSSVRSSNNQKPLTQNHNNNNKDSNSFRNSFEVPLNSNNIPYGNQYNESNINHNPTEIPLTNSNLPSTLNKNNNNFNFANNTDLTKLPPNSTTHAQNNINTIANNSSQP